MKEIVVENNDQKKRLDLFITEELPEISRTAVKRLIEEEKVLVNGKKQKSSSGSDGGVRWCQLCVFSRAISSKCLIFRQFKLFLYSDS